MWKALIKLVNKWAYRCDHEWEALKTFEVKYDENSTIPYRFIYTYRCKKCCEVKTIFIDGEQGKF